MSEAVVEVETPGLRVRVAGPRLVTLAARAVQDGREPPWIRVYPGLWISPPSLRDLTAAQDTVTDITRDRNGPEIALPQFKPGLPGGHGMSRWRVDG